jgi:hypothetical protein
MFKLEQAIADWRRQIAACGIASAPALDELEDHLREEVSQQTRAGLTSHHAFEVAVQKIGPGKVLKPEFITTVDSNEARERTWKLVWMGIGATAYAAPIALNGPHLLSQLNLTERWLAVAAFALTVVSSFSGLAIYRFLPVIPEKQSRTRFQVATFLPVFIWVCAFAFVVLPRIEFTIGRLLVITLWALCPLGLFGGVVFGLDEAARRRTSAPNT